MSPKDSDLLVCLISNIYVGMHSHASGPAVLLQGSNVAIRHLSICQVLSKKSGF
jgi:hypothetical protein